MLFRRRNELFLIRRSMFHNEIIVLLQRQLSNVGYQNTKIFPILVLELCRVCHATCHEFGNFPTEAINKEKKEYSPYETREEKSLVFCSRQYHVENFLRKFPRSCVFFAQTRKT
jgi:hypothetical protein